MKFQALVLVGLAVVCMAISANAACKKVDSKEFCEGVQICSAKDGSTDKDCFECTKDCDCPVNHFCPTTKDSTNFKKCVKMDFLGNTCNYGASALTWTKKADVQKESCAMWDDGAKAQYSGNGKGACVAGKCRNPQCVSSWSDFAGQVSQVICAGDKDGVGPVRFCVDGIQYKAGARQYFIGAIFSQSPQNVILTVIMAFLIFSMLLWILATVFSMMCGKKKE